MIGSASGPVIAPLGKTKRQAYHAGDTESRSVSIQWKQRKEDARGKTRGNMSNCGSNLAVRLYRGAAWGSDYIIYVNVLCVLRQLKQQRLKI